MLISMDTTGPKVVTPDPVITTLEGIIAEQRLRIDALTAANDWLCKQLAARDQEWFTRRNHSRLQRLITWLGKC